jgi:hypothetical protein
MVGDEEKLQASDKKISFLYRILRGGKSKEEIFTNFQPLLKSSLSNRKTVSSKSSEYEESMTFAGKKRGEMSKPCRALWYK